MGGRRRPRARRVARGGPYALAVEPEPGMLVEDCDGWARLAAEVPGLTLALDTGHCVVAGRYAPEEAVAAFAPRLGTVAVEGMRRGVHDHLPFGEGDVDLPAVLRALIAAGWDRLVIVELSRGRPPRARDGAPGDGHPAGRRDGGAGVRVCFVSRRYCPR